MEVSYALLRSVSNPGKQKEQVFHAAVLLFALCLLLSGKEELLAPRWALYAQGFSNHRKWLKFKKRSDNMNFQESVWRDS